jgi:hypothetical protein
MAYLDDESGLDELELDFVPAEVKREYDTLPTADYVVDIESIKPSWNEANDVMTLVVKLRVAEGEHERKVVFARHVGKIADPNNEKAAKRLKYGREALGELARAASVPGANLAPAIGQRVIARVKLRPEQNGYPESNEVGSYKPIVKAPVAAKPAAAKAAAPAPAKTNAAPAFMKKPPKPAPEPEVVDDGDESADD